MKTKDISITSKNQITLPTEYVRIMQLARNRVLRAEIRKGSIVLTPQPTLSHKMQQFWGKHSAKRPLTDEELKQATRSVAAARAAKSI